MNKYTKGPWNNDDYNGAVNPSVSGADHANVATCGGKHRPKSEKSANARLIATAPELLEALEWFCHRVDIGEVRSKKTYAHFKQLITKVKEPTK